MKLLRRSPKTRAWCDSDIIHHQDALGDVKAIPCACLKPQDLGVIACVEVNDRKSLVLLSIEAGRSALKRAQLASQWLLYHHNAYTSADLIPVHPSVIESLTKSGAQSRAVQSTSTSVSRFKSLLKQCIELQASDIHIVASKSQVQVKARVLGELIPVTRFDYADMTAILAALYNQHAEAMSKDITFDELKEQRTVINMHIENNEYQLRFESTPIHPYGSYKVVTRILKQNAKLSFKDLSSLGYSADQVAVIDEALLADNGLIIISGETGSGKTTTLATMLHQINAMWGQGVSINSVESPVEYVIEGVNQIPVHQGMLDTHEDVSAKFARKLSGLLRSDPDVVMVGEVSDVHTAKALQQVVQSGTKVLTTIHTSSALKVLGRLVGLGLEKDVVGEPDFLKLIIHQKLIPILCDHCALPISSIKDKKLLADIKALSRRYGLKDRIDKVRLRNRSGNCPHCAPHNGIVGREVIAEVVNPSVKLLEALKSSDMPAAYKLWRESGGISYQERGIARMFAGSVCPQELLRRIGSFSAQGVFAHIDARYYEQIGRGVYCDVKSQDELSDLTNQTICTVR